MTRKKMTEREKKVRDSVWRTLKKEKERPSRPGIWDKSMLNTINNPDHIGLVAKRSILEMILKTIHDIPRRKLGVSYLRKLKDIAAERAEGYKSFKWVVVKDYYNRLGKIADAHLRRKARMHRKTWRRLERTKQR